MIEVETSREENLNNTSSRKRIDSVLSKLLFCVALRVAVLRKLIC